MFITHLKQKRIEKIEKMFQQNAMEIDGERRLQSDRKVVNLRGFNHDPKTQNT